VRLNKLEITLTFEQKLDTYINEQMQRKHIPGLSLAVIKDGVTVVEQNYGLANVELGVPATSDTVYEIASITKGFTAAAIMLLVEAGKLSLDDPLARFRADLPAAWQVITVQRLLTHTSGIPQWELHWDREDLTIAEIEQAVFGRSLRFAPGTAFEYVDTNYNLLGMIIHQLTGVPYDAFLQERIFQPLDMNSTRHNAVRAIVANRAEGYEWENEQLRKSFRIQWNNINRSPSVPANAANGGLLSSLRDLIKWDTALTNGQILSQASQDALWSPLLLNNGLPVPYEHDWHVQNFRGHRLIEFGGGAPGFTTCMARFAADRLTVIILTNQDSKPWDMCKDVAGLVEPALT
jgi:D-alanyl-D-alanine carboxypeptidase